MCIYTVHIFKKIKIIVVIPNLFIYLLLLTELMYLSLKVNKYGKTIFLIFHRHEIKVKTPLPPFWVTSQFLKIPDLSPPISRQNFQVT